MEPSSFFISAGDVSGDIHAAGLIAKARALAPEGAWFGLGGSRMAAAGCRLIAPPESDPVMGFVRVAARIPRYLGLLARVDHVLACERPRLVVLVDYPGLNLQVARLARRAGIPVVYFICPQYWAWAPWRARTFARLVDQALVIFPFEERYFASRGVATKWVGHPICDRVAAALEGESTLAAGRERELALLPGSRIQEIESNLPVMLAAAAALREQDSSLRPVVVHQQPECLALSLRIAREAGMPLEAREEEICRGVQGARLCLVTSGTATLEVALAGTPLVVIYRVSGLVHRLARWFLTAPWFCQVNLIAGKEIVPEFLLQSASPAPILPACRRLIAEGSARSTMLADLARFRDAHDRPGALSRAATEVLRCAEEAASFTSRPEPGPPAPEKPCARTGP